MMASAANLPCTESKICVETDIDTFLCTDDMATARQRAMRRNDEPLRFAGLGLDLGVEQRNDGQPHQRAGNCDSREPDLEPAEREEVERWLADSGATMEEMSSHNDEGVSHVKTTACEMLLEQRTAVKMSR